jgi:hypothetical protein
VFRPPFAITTARAFRGRDIKKVSRRCCWIRKTPAGRPGRVGASNHANLKIPSVRPFASVKRNCTSELRWLKPPLMAVCRDLAAKWGAVETVLIRLRPPRASGLHTRNLSDPACGFFFLTRNVLAAMADERTEHPRAIIFSRALAHALPASHFQFPLFHLRTAFRIVDLTTFRYPPR